MANHTTIIARLFAASAAMGALLAAGSARADGADGFSKQGQVAITGDFQLSFQHSSIKPPEGDSTSTNTITLGPSADYFVIDNLSIGGQLLFSRTWNDDGHANTFAVTPRVGYNVGINETLSFWPRVGVTYSTTSFGSDKDTGPAANNNSGDRSSSSFALGVYAPLEVHLAPHFFIGIGPNFSTDLSSTVKAGDQSADGSKETRFGVMTEVGGYF